MFNAQVLTLVIALQYWSLTEGRRGDFHLWLGFLKKAYLCHRFFFFNYYLFLPNSVQRCSEALCLGSTHSAAAGALGGWGDALSSACHRAGGRVSQKFQWEHKGSGHNILQNRTSCLCTQGGSGKPQPLAWKKYQRSCFTVAAPAGPGATAGHAALCPLTPVQSSSLINNFSV